MLTSHGWNLEKRGFTHYKLVTYRFYFIKIARKVFPVIPPAQLP